MMTRVDHFITFTNRHRHRLFTKYMFANLRSGDGLGPVKTDRRGDIDRINLVISNQGCVARVGARDIKTITEFLKFFWVSPTGSNQLAVAMAPNCVSDPSLGNIAGTENSPTDVQCFAPF